MSVFNVFVEGFVDFWKVLLLDRLIDYIYFDVVLVWLLLLLRYGLGVV